MTESVNPQGLSLAEAQALLNRLGYRTDWTVPELIEAMGRLPAAKRAVVPDALRIVAAFELREARILELKRLGGAS